MNRVRAYLQELSDLLNQRNGRALNLWALIFGTCASGFAILAMLLFIERSLMFHCNPFIPLFRCNVPTSVNHFYSEANETQSLNTDVTPGHGCQIAPCVFIAIDENVISSVSNFPLRSTAVISSCSLANLTADQSTTIQELGLILIPMEKWYDEAANSINAHYCSKSICRKFCRLCKLFMASFEDSLQVLMNTISTNTNAFQTLAVRLAKTWSTSTEPDESMILRAYTHSITIMQTIISSFLKYPSEQLKAMFTGFHLVLGGCLALYVSFVVYSYFGTHEQRNYQLIPFKTQEHLDLQGKLKRLEHHRYSRSSLSNTDRIRYKPDLHGKSLHAKVGNDATDGMESQGLKKSLPTDNKLAIPDVNEKPPNPHISSEHIYNAQGKPSLSLDSQGRSITNRREHLRSQRATSTSHCPETPPVTSASGSTDALTLAQVPSKDVSPNRSVSVSHELKLQEERAILWGKVNQELQQKFKSPRQI